VGDFHPQQGVENAAPFQVAVVARLELFADADQRLLERVLAARVQHLLLDGGVLRTPGQADSSGSRRSLLTSGSQTLDWYNKTIVNHVLLAKNNYYYIRLMAFFPGQPG